MALFYITGIAGAGKSTVLNGLKARGYEAHGVDEDGFAHWHNNHTGYVHPKSSISTEQRTAEFIRDHSWKISRKMVEDLGAKAADKTVFLCGVASNDNEIWDLFLATFALVLDTDTLMQRISTRTTNDYGKAPHELAQTIEQHEASEAMYDRLGYIKIDATQPTKLILDSILDKVKERG